MLSQNSYANYYTQLALTPIPEFFFGENVDTGDSIEWYQERVGNPHNNEIQDYERGQVGLDSNDYLVLRIDRVGSNLYDSSRVNSSVYNGIKIGSGEKLTVEFEAQLPMAKDSNGNYVPNVPLWPALWLMGNDRINNVPIDGHIVLKLMLWNGPPLSHHLEEHQAMKHRLIMRSIGMAQMAMDTLIGVILNIIIFRTHTLNFINGELISIDMMMVLTQIR